MLACLIKSDTNVQAIVLLDGGGDTCRVDGRGPGLQPGQHDQADAQTPDEGEAAALHDLQAEHLRRAAQAQDQAGPGKVPPPAGESGEKRPIHNKGCVKLDPCHATYTDPELCE